VSIQTLILSIRCSLYTAPQIRVPCLYSASSVPTLCGRCNELINRSTVCFFVQSLQICQVSEQWHIIVTVRGAFLMNRSAGCMRSKTQKAQFHVFWTDLSWCWAWKLLTLTTPCRCISVVTTATIRQRLVKMFRTISK